MNTPSTTSGLSASVARQGRIIRKELNEILRDRRTILTLVLMPLLIYPLLGVGFVQFVRTMAPVAEPKFFVGSEDVKTIGVFRAIEEHVRPEMRRFAKEDGKPPLWEARHVQSAEKALKANDIDIALEFIPDKDDGKKTSRTVAFQMTYYRKAPGAATAALWIERIVAVENGKNFDSLLRVPGAPSGPGVITLHRNVLASGHEADTLISLGSVIPFILILMTITGAVYPAIDLTAGERERGTMEVLMAAPVPRLSLLFAKYVAVLFVAVLTAVVNLTAMTATMMLNPLGKTLIGPAGLSLGLLLQLFAILLLFAAFFSALLLTITSFARSFKEAQSYLIPLMLLAMAPGAAGLVPGLELTPMLAVTPLVNIVLLGRDLLEGHMRAGILVLVVVSTVIYAVASLGLAARIFGAEGVLYNEQNSWGDLYRRAPKPRPEATPSHALWSLALMVPTFFVLEGVLRATLPITPLALALGMIGLSVALFLGLPGIFAWHERVTWRSGFGIAGAKLPGWLAAIALGVSLWALVLPSLAWIQGTPPDWLRKTLDEALKQMRNASGASQTLRAALIGGLVGQAILEELFFRGFLWGALVRRTRLIWTLTSTAFLFGLAHVVTGGPLGLERLLPSLLMGLILGFVRVRSGSVLPCILLHAIHNGILGAIAVTEFAGGPINLTWQWTALAAAVAAGGMGLLIWACPKASEG